MSSKNPNMYYLMNIATSKCITRTKTKMEMLISWMNIVNGINRYCLIHRKYDNINFDNLNLTGKDTITKQDAIFDTNLKMIVYKSYRTLRMYQILDEFGRSIDARLWKEEIQRILSGNILYDTYITSIKHLTFRQASVFTGAKRHCHRIHLPKMMVQFASQRNAASHENRDELYDIGLTDHMIVHSKPRSRHTIEDATIDIDYKVNQRYGVKNWKKQTKNATQWEKHKSCVRKNKRKWHQQYVPLDIETLTQQLVKSI